MTSPTKQSGLTRPTHESSFARLDNFAALESDWRMLLHRLIVASTDLHYRDDDGREGELFSLWANHVLTVLVEIAALKDSAGAGNLQDSIERWISRLNHYIDRSWKNGNGETSATRAARQLKDRLENALPDKKDLGNKNYYQMLGALGGIQELFDYYLSQIEDSGDMDGALSLLLAYLRNYGGIAQAFNQRFAGLPELYLRDILHAVPQAAKQDNTYIVVTPMPDTPGFTLPLGQPFPAGQNVDGEELIYRSHRPEYITPMQCAEANAVYIQQENGKATGIRKQSIPFRNVATPETLFADKHSKPMPLGWTLSSSMLVMDEGERKVRISFRITPDTVFLLPPGPIPKDSFNLQLSIAEGWINQPSLCRIDTADGYHRLCFDFLLPPDGPAPAPCSEEIHGTTTDHPALRILAGHRSCPYDWASRLAFDAVKIQTNVSGIRNFTFYNELGQVDTSQPLRPFGLKAEKGAWFIFGNEEIGLKPLKEVRLKGLWKKLPETEAQFNQLYKNYTAAAGQTVDINSFCISTEWQKGGQWHPCEDGVQHLFVPDHTGSPAKIENRSLSRAEVFFDFTEISLMARNASVPYEYSRDRDGFFRTTLLSPSIGFGTDAYRTLFTETMIHNSRNKEKKHKDLPPEPVIPLLADVELSYIASEETTLADISRSSIRLSRVTALSDQDSYPLNKVDEQLLLPAFATDHLLYFAFLHAKGEQTVRMYFDLVLPKEKIPFYNPQPGKSIRLAWEFWNGSKWLPIDIDSIRAEETLGLTQSGFIEIRLPEKIKDSHMDEPGRIWIRAALQGDVSSCLAIGNIYTNCIRLTAQNGDGSSLPAGTIQGLIEPDERIESIVQPLPGFGGMPAESKKQTAVRQSSHISNRHRAVMLKDYERLVMEHFPEVDKVECLSVPQEKGASDICLVVFSRTDDSRYFLSPAWKLAEIQRIVRPYAPAFVSLRVINPVYELVKVHCKAVLWDKVQDEGKAVRQLVVLAQNYIAPWYRKGEIPSLRQSFSYKELHARMANHEDLMKLIALDVHIERTPPVVINEQYPVFKGKHLWSVLLPKVTIELLSPHDGIENAEIGGNFIIR